MTLKIPLCFECKYYQGDYTCKAYPRGIPDEIIINKIDHRYPYLDDNGIRFKPSKDAIFYKK